MVIVVKEFFCILTKFMIYSSLYYVSLVLKPNQAGKSLKCCASEISLTFNLLVSFIHLNMSGFCRA